MKKVIILLIILGIFLVLAILGGIAAAVYFTWPKQSNDLTLPKQRNDTIDTSPVDLAGNFTILNKTIGDPDVSNTSICNYLTNILTSENLNTADCMILDLRNGSVKVQYRLVIENQANQYVYNILNRASSAIAKTSSDNSIFLIDQSSIKFYNKDGVVRNYCQEIQRCPDGNSLCISVVNGYVCVCRPGYVQLSVGNSCQLPSGSRYCEPNGNWIAATSVCNKYQDCPNDIDEINCPCDTSYQYSCRNGRCIYKTWLCDGVKDCPFGDDENPSQCASCSADEFLCATPRRCIQSRRVCDGNRDCNDSSDESHCLTSNASLTADVVTVTYKGKSGYHICSDNWTEEWSNVICKYMGYGNASGTTSVPINGNFLSFNLMAASSSSNLMAYFKNSTCMSGKAIRIECEISSCGVRTVSAESVGPYIINGQRATRGAWPWQVIVYTGSYVGADFYSALICGGILLNERWILTAAHCTEIDTDAGLGYAGQTKPENVQIVLGTISRMKNPDMIFARVDQVHTHPLYDSVIIDNDVGLMRLSQPVNFTDTVKPICLPASNQDLSRLKVCVDTGFGRTILGTVSNDLLQARMNVLPFSSCAKIYRNTRNDTQICIGTDAPEVDINICNGDSGGPLACQDQNGVWMAIGVNSYGSTRCRFLSVVARVTAFLNWIQTTISTNSI